MVYITDIVRMNIGQLQHPQIPPDADFTGQTIIITGANTGLGLEAAKHIYSRNVARLILACRSVAKGEAAIERIRSSRSAKQNGSSSPVIEVWPLDLTSFASVLEFGARVRREAPDISAFINNAGVSINTYEEFEGWESMLLVNVISTVLLALLVLPILQQSKSRPGGRPPSLTFVGSVVHIFAKDQYLTSSGSILEELNDRKKADMEDRYNLSKLILLLAYRALVSELEQQPQKSRVTINYINPGWCRTELFRTNDGGFGGRVGLRLIGRTAEEGSRTLVHAITAGRESHGTYMSECAVRPESGFVRSDEGRKVQARLWDELRGVLEDIAPGVTKHQQTGG